MRPPRALPAAILTSALLVLAGCAGGPVAADRSTDADPPRPERDGPGANPPPNLAAVPDAEPKLEPIRIGGPNKPYVIYGETYRPITEDVPFTQRGLASWYGRKFHGARTSSGERYDMYAMTAAHPTMPIPSYARVRNPTNGREVVVRINDRGPFHSDRIMDLSYTAALKLDVLRGVTTVELRRITGDEIRAGLAGRNDSASASASAPAPAPAPAGVPVTVAEVVPIAATEPSMRIESPRPAPTNDATDPVATAPRADPSNTGTPAATPGYWLQFGAFRAREGALALQQQVAGSADWLAPLLAVFHDGPWFRLQAGPFADRGQAIIAGDRARREARQTTLVVERP